MGNVLKILRCYWKHPINKTEYKFVSYFVLYERVGHTSNPKYDESYGYKRLICHEDKIDVEIYQALERELNKIAGIKELVIQPNEGILHYGEELALKSRALMSKIAVGYPFRGLRIISQTNENILLSAKVFFMGIKNDEFLQNLILPMIPWTLKLATVADISTVIRAEFLSTMEADKILHVGEGIDLSKFETQANS